MDYNLTNLGSLDFENMTAALFERFLGVRVTQFGVGPDGGREATYRGSITRLGDDPLDWDGYVLLQSKFRARPLGTSADQDWLIGTVERELKEWESQTSARRQENDIPDYLVIATNVVLTPAAGGGGIDRLEAHLNARTKALEMKGWLVWHHDKICRMLDNSRDIRAAYGSLLTSGDVLAKLHELLEGEAANISDAVRSFTSDNLVRQRHVRLTESGGTGNLTLEQVGVDLPCASVTGTSERTAIRALIDLGDADLRPGVVDGPDGTYLLIGGPGQGKSTLSNMLAQLYRVALLQDDPERNGAQPAEIIAKSLTWAARERLHLPRKRRWPIRIDLAEIDASQPLLKTITTVVSDRVGYQVPAPQLLSWLQQWPWVLILDGFDEVAAATSRSQVFDNVSGFLAQAASRRSDLLTIITTRPQGYDNEFDIPGVQHIRLEPLTTAQAISYAGGFAREHFGDDDEERTRVLDRLTEASHEENVARLLQTPLQATIMTLLLAEGHAPRDRYLLFNAYYDAIYKREAAKSKSVASDLNDYRAEIHQLHEQCGLELQRLSEESGSFDATLPETTLQQLAAHNFTAAGFGEEEAQKLAAGLARTATHRLVLLVPKGAGIGFEVRSLQEYMAARALTSGPEPDALARLQTIAPSAHWRNAWLFAVGRFVTDRPHMQQQLLDMVRNPGADPLARRLGLGVELAAALTMDGIGNTRPALRFELLEILLEAFGLPPLPFDISEPLSVLAGERSVLKSRVFVQLKRLEEGQAPADLAAAAYRIVEPLSSGDGPLGGPARQTLRTLKLSGPQKLAATRPWVTDDQAVPPVNQVTLASFIQDDSDLSELVEPDEVDMVKPFTKALRARSVSVLQADPRIVIGSAKRGGERTELPYPTADNARLAIVTALESITPHSWGAATEISDSLWRSLRRQPVGDKVCRS